MNAELSDLEQAWLDLEHARLGELDQAKKNEIAEQQKPIEQNLLESGDQINKLEEPLMGGVEKRSSPRFIIVGGGVGGTCLGARLRQHGFDNFVILEKSDDIGGTWHHNNYPGVACDVASYYYSYTFCPNPNWTKMFAPGKEIKAYLRKVADHFNLKEKTRLNSKVASCRWSDGEWNVTLESGDVLDADYLLLASGFLHIPKMPSFKKQDAFQGKIYHSTEWTADLDISGLRIGVIGNGSSSVQIVSSITDEAKSVTVFQRTPQWVFPAENDDYSESRRAMLAKHPNLLAKLYEYFMVWYNEGFGKAAVGDTDAQKFFADACQANVESITDPELREKLMPDYPVLCKRIVFSSTYFKALQEEHVSLITDAIEQFEPTGIRTRDGRLHELDLIVMATGFETHSYFRTLNLSVENGPTVEEAWKDGAKSFDTVALAGFPNLFFLGGPFSTVGNLSVMNAFEIQSNHIMSVIEKALAEGAGSVAPRQSRQDEFVETMRRSEKDTAWLQGCNSWYLDEHGHVSIWTRTPDDFFEHMRREPDLDDYEVIR